MTQLFQETREERSSTLGIEVNGTVQDTNLTSVTVNGTMAEVSGETFIAKDILIEEGLNTITAVATDRAGNTAEATVHGVLDTDQKIVYSYNTNGNLVEKGEDAGTTKYIYDGAGRLMEVDLANGRTASYAYDSEGRRITATENDITRNSFYDGTKRDK